MLEVLNVGSNELLAILFYSELLLFLTINYWKIDFQSNFVSISLWSQCVKQARNVNSASVGEKRDANRFPWCDANRINCVASQMSPRWLAATTFTSRSVFLLAILCWFIFENLFLKCLETISIHSSESFPPRAREMSCFESKVCGIAPTQPTFWRDSSPARWKARSKDWARLKRQRTLTRSSTMKRFGE